MRWPTLSEWGVIALLFIFFFIALLVALAGAVSRRDVRRLNERRARDRSR